MNPRALGFLLLSAWPLMAATPHLANLAVAVARNPGDGVAAARLGAALALQDWMLPSAPPARVAWLPGALRGTPSLGPVPAPDGRREVRLDGRNARLLSLPDGAPMAEGTLAGTPWAVAWHPSGMVLALATPEGIEIRDGRTLRASVVRLAGAAGPALAFSPDGVWLVTGASEGGVLLWDWASGRAMATGCPGVGRVESLAFDTTGTWVRAGTLGAEVVLDARRGMAWDAWWGGLSPLAGAAFASGGTNVVTVDAQGRVDRAPWVRPASGTTLLLASAPRAMALDSTGEWAATALAPSKARLWNLKTGLPVGAWVTHPDVSRVAVGKDGSWLWTASGSSVRAVKPVVGQPWVVVSNEPVHAFVGTASGEWMAAVAGAIPAATARLWRGDDPTAAAVLFPVPVPGPFDLDPTGSWAISANAAGDGAGGGLIQRLARTPDAPTDRPVIGPGRAFEEARYAAGGRWVVARQGGEVTVWDAVTGKAKGKPIGLAGASLGGVDVSPDGRWLRGEGADGSVGLWALEAGERVAGMEAGARRGKPVGLGGASLGGVDVSPDGRWLRGEGADGSVGLWALEAGARRGKPVGLGGARFDPDGLRVLVPDGSGGVRLVPLPPLAPAPAWLGDWARWVWGRTNAALEGELGTLRKAMADADPRDPWTAWGRWWLAGRESRATAPTSRVMASEWAAWWAGRRDPVAALEAWRTGPGDVAVRAALARQMQTNHAWNRQYRAEQGAWLAR